MVSPLKRFFLLVLLLVVVLDFARISRTRTRTTKITTI
jgi:hypothetical protein